MKFEPKSEKTRLWIIETTAPIFNKKGYAGTSISDLTEATGMTKGAIYGNFENKEDIALAAFEYNLKNRSGILRKAMDSAPTNKEKLLVYAEIFRPAKKTPFPEGGCPMQNTGIEADDTHELLREKAAQALESSRKLLEDFVSKGIAAGEFLPGINARRFATGLLAMVEGGIMLSGITKKNKDIELVSDAIADLVNSISLS